MPAGPLMDEYTWIFAFIAAFGIGANDVANSFDSSVGAKAITLPQALLIAAVCEFSGAVLLGSGVTDTIKGGIANPQLFAGTPDLFLYGFFCVMLAAAFWDNFSCHLHLPVSTTHTTVGGTVGMALAIYGGNAVIWSTKKAEFPFIGGMVPVFLSWIVSPIIAGVFVLILFGLLRMIVLRSPSSFARSLYVLPACVFLLFFTLTIFIYQTYLKNKLKLSSNKLPTAVEIKTVWVGAVTGAIAAILSSLIGWLVLKPRVLALDERMQVSQQAKAAAVEAQNGAATDAEKEAAARAMADIDAAAYGEKSAFAQKITSWWVNFKATRVGDLLTNNVVSRTVSYGATYKVHDDIAGDTDVTAVWDHAEVFDFKTERVFRYLQVITAWAMSFAHGSNDVANAMGPFSAVYQTWSTGVVRGKSANVPYWILCMGGAGIVVGLATYGHKIMSVLAVKSVKLTNSRGFCVELASALTVILASRFGLPVSTTQIVVGAVWAIGLMEGRRGVNWRMAARIAVGWVLTLIVAGAVAAAFASFGVYTPSKSASMAAAAVRAAAKKAAAAATP